jgi:methylated-DNA-[protein]-cysteine S-methyltransferase
MTTRFCWMASPIGRLLLAGDGRALLHLGFGFGPRPARPASDWREDPGPLREAVRQLEQYFAGDRRVFELSVAPEGTPFQCAVWTALRTIPYGSTWSYAQLAGTVGNPRAVRAVGLANGRNPIAIVIPCHRVIGSDGTLTGFGGGLDAKRFLLDHERGARAEAKAGSGLET